MLIILHHIVVVIKRKETSKYSIWSILFNLSIMVALTAAMSTGIIWMSVEPILEPELRKEVCMTCLYYFSSAYL